MAVWFYILATCWLTSTLRAEQAFNTVDNSDKARQLLYVPQSPQLQRLELVDENVESPFVQNLQNRGAQTFNIRVTDPNGPQGASKIETLEPDAEIIPGAQTPPQAQIPVAPPGASIPGLLPGQSVYILHPQHQIFMNPLYPGIPNSFRPNVQVQGLPNYQQPFYIVQAQPNDGSYAAPGIAPVGYQGYQNAIFLDPSSGQPIAPQYIQPNYQQLTNPLQSRFPVFPYQAQPVEESNRYQQKVPIAQEQQKDNNQQSKAQLEQLKANQPGGQQINNAQQQFNPESEQIDGSYIPLRRPEPIPYQQFFLGGPPFAPPFFLQQRGVYHLGGDKPQYAGTTFANPEQGGFLPVPGKRSQDALAQGRSDYSLEETKDDVSKELKPVEEKKTPELTKADEPREPESKELQSDRPEHVTSATK